MVLFRQHRLIQRVLPCLPVQHWLQIPIIPSEGRATMLSRPHNIQSAMASSIVRVALQHTLLGHDAPRPERVRGQGWDVLLQLHDELGCCKCNQLDVSHRVNKVRAQRNLIPVAATVAAMAGGEVAIGTAGADEPSRDSSPERRIHRTHGVGRRRRCMGSDGGG